jgi:hypothetical protein
LTPGIGRVRFHREAGSADRSRWTRRRVRPARGCRCSWRANQLIGGQLVVAEPQDHSSGRGCGRRLRSALPPGWLVRVRCPWPRRRVSAGPTWPRCWANVELTTSRATRPLSRSWWKWRVEPGAFDRRAEGQPLRSRRVPDCWILPNLVDRVGGVSRPVLRCCGLLWLACSGTVGALTRLAQRLRAACPSASRLAPFVV